MKRRDFLKGIIKSFFVLLAAVLVLPVLSLYPSRIKKKTVSFFPVLDEDELPRQGVRRAEFFYESRGRRIHTKVFVVVSEEGMIALSPVCSHLGCLVNWDNNKKEFLCPCHGGRYGMNGRVIAGPPPEPLRRLPFEIRDGKAYVGMKV